MKKFFLYKTELPIDSGFDTFGYCHWLWIIGIGIFSWYMGRFFSFAEKQQVMRLRNIMKFALPLMELSRVLVLVANGHFMPNEYPLHLCNMSLFLGAIYLWTKNRYIGVVYVLLCLPAAALAIIFPGWLRYPFLNYMHIHNFLYHGIVVALGWGLVRSRELVPEWKELWKPLSFGLVGYVIMFQVNKMLDTNFWFINTPSYGSPLAVLYGFFSSDWYLVGHFSFCSSIVILWHILLRWYVCGSNCRTKSIYIRR